MFPILLRRCSSRALTGHVSLLLCSRAARRTAIACQRNEAGNRCCCCPARHSDQKSEVKPRSLILLAKPPLSRCPTYRGNATFEIMPSANLDALHEIKAAHPPRTGWWFYPSEEKTNVQ